MTVKQVIVTNYLIIRGNHEHLQSHGAKSEEVPRVGSVSLFVAGCPEKTHESLIQRFR